ncbi:WXG100 family type VII secretion target [Streptomyces sp. TR02-1]|uniref:WXG100 family type VII secretion target n=1 Tax=Streptomyces sp. TR02-1 TaxID=3385977 RepID=UPI0039A1707D
MGMSYSNPSGMTAEERAEVREEAKREHHEQGLREHQSESEAYENLNAAFPLTTNFHGFGLNDLKGMVASAKPDEIRNVGESWKHVHNQLVGPDGYGLGDCAYGQLKKAVDNVLQHWEGRSADRFREQAYKILNNIYNTGQHCDTVSLAMKQASDDLRAQKARVEALEEPSWFDRAMDRLGDSGRDDKYTQEDVKNKNLPKDLIADINEDQLSEGKEVQLKAVAIMETLGRSYVGYTKRMESNRRVDEKDGVPSSDPTSPMPTPIPAFSGSSATPSGAGRGTYAPSSNVGTKTPTTTGPRDVGISGGKQVPIGKTQLDSVKPGLSGPNPETVPGGGPRTAGPVASGPTGPHGTPGIPSGGGAPRTTPGSDRRSGGPRAGIRGTGAGSGKSTAGGGFRGRAGGGSGSGSRGGIGKSGGRGPLARAKGGVAGAPRGIAGGRPATPGGTGLGKGRGGASGSGSGNRKTLAGSARGSNQRPGEEENDQFARPDYLVEDEETWTPEDNRSTPGTID